MKKLRLLVLKPLEVLTALFTSAVVIVIYTHGDALEHPVTLTFSCLGLALFILFIDYILSRLGFRVDHK